MDEEKKDEVLEESEETEDIEESVEEEEIELKEEGIEEALGTEKNGFNLSFVPLILGILITLGTVGIKFSGIDPFIGIENPSGVYGHLFLSGVVVGLIIFVIGLAMTVMSKKQVKPEIAEEEVEPFEEEEEMVEEGICPTCGAVIPIDSEECSECGEELAPPEEEEVVEEVKECPICGAEVSAESEECPECGEPLTEEEEDEDLFADLEDI